MKTDISSYDFLKEDDLLSYYKSKIDFVDESIASRYLYLRICRLEEKVDSLLREKRLTRR